MAQMPVFFKSLFLRQCVPGHRAMPLADGHAPKSAAEWPVHRAYADIASVSEIVVAFIGRRDAEWVYKPPAIYASSLGASVE